MTRRSVFATPRCPIWTIFTHWRDICSAMAPMALSLGWEVSSLVIGRAEEIAPAYATIEGRAEALLVCADPLVNTNRVQITALSFPKIISARSNDAAQTE
jgi:hypothetical protein